MAGVSSLSTFPGAEGIRGGAAAAPAWRALSPAGVGAMAGVEGVTVSEIGETRPSSAASRVIVRNVAKNNPMSRTPPMPNQISVATAMTNGMPTPAISQ
jgi:hypothetical protein